MIFLTVLSPPSNSSDTYTYCTPRTRALLSELSQICEMLPVPKHPLQHNKPMNELKNTQYTTINQQHSTIQSTTYTVHYNQLQTTNIVHDNQQTRNTTINYKQQTQYTTTKHDPTTRERERKRKRESMIVLQ
jgi:hypothetical protein